MFPSSVDIAIIGAGAAGLGAAHALKASGLSFIVLEARDRAGGAGADQLLADSVADIGAPTLAHYRDVYANLGLDWPGDAEIRAMYPVADGVLSR